MKRMAAALLVAAFALSWASGSSAYTATIAQTAADTASVLLVQPGPGQAIQINNITVWYDNAANTNPVYVGIQVANHPRLRAWWAGQAMASSGIAPVTILGPIKVAAAQDSLSAATKGALLFISATSSDSLAAWIDYDIVPR